MPELPEMENYRILLHNKLASKRITDVSIGREKSLNVPEAEFISSVKGKTVLSVTRRAKHLIFTLSDGQLLVLHLMLGGWMFWGEEEEKPNRTFQIILSFGSESLYFIGLRLGHLHLLTRREAERIFAELGPEPLTPDFTYTAFQALLAKKRGRLKIKLVDQHFISGIGNCYSDEICFEAGILPFRDISSLKPEQQEKLYHSIRTLLPEAIQKGGYMENPLYRGDQLTGGFDSLCRVYDRGGEPCLRCGGKVKKDIISSRKTFYCPDCQS
ncbi:Fpg/Nei family DNA glycosylase [Peribacillus kribbensis]|uniref:Fpg/Nei family DNA glycosylase n=1 Tax=Peribacillus kribbensis TaxID=356658 RepID=UPI0003FB0C65|nr:DNA-formamidopyrimidine glycosylase family protein [Peribacillus kribbensis]